MRAMPYHQMDVHERRGYAGVDDNREYNPHDSEPTIRERDSQMRVRVSRGEMRMRGGRGGPSAAVYNQPVYTGGETEYLPP